MCFPKEMRLALSAVFALIFCALPFFAGAKEMSLSEKIALAKKVADDAAAGKIASGTVVDASVDMGKTIARYREQMSGREKMHGSVVSAIDEAVQSEEELIKKSLKAEAKVEKIEPIPGDRGEPEKVLERRAELKPSVMKEPEILPIEGRPSAPGKESLPRAGQSGDFGVGKEQGQISKPKVPTKDLPSVARGTSGEETAAKSGASVKGEASDKKDVGGEVNPIEKASPGIARKRQKFIPVDTSKNFINGHYVPEPLIGPDGKEIDIKSLSKQQVYEYRDSFFKVFSDDSQALSRVVPVLKECGNLVKGYFFEDAKLPALQQVELRILTSDLAGGGKVGAQIFDNGAVVLSAKWDENLDLTSFCRLVSGGALRAVAQYFGGAQGMKNLPYWLELAFESALEQRLRFGVVNDMARLAERSQPESAKKIFGLERGNVADIELSKAHAYWNLEALKELTGVKFPRFFKNLIAKNASAEDEYLILCDTLGLSPEDVDMRWQTVVTAMIYSKLGGIQSMETTRDEIKRLAILPFIKENGEVEGLSGMQLFERRDEEGLEELTANRIFELKVALSKSNPVYHNALVALGRIYEALYDGDEELYRSSLTDFAKELKTSDIIADKARQLMNSAPSLEDDQSKEESVGSGRRRADTRASSSLNHK